ncbi:uncharacterized protein B0H64DRAFT_135710 [Chaetomium fimeti]|uniref:Uncharacterized protein n=1 Tax=Chaetomium fimeti TaxID=1854472 RepID=A0AAE0LUP3_9PEZI|nr:hypothetical protein B0H64DRAFT_135710 [Chaetomium fimeti]
MNGRHHRPGDSTVFFSGPKELGSTRPSARDPGLWFVTPVAWFGLDHNHGTCPDATEQFHGPRGITISKSPRADTKEPTPKTPLRRRWEFGQRRMVLSSSPDTRRYEYRSVSTTASLLLRCLRRLRASWNRQERHWLPEKQRHGAHAPSHPDDTVLSPRISRSAASRHQPPSPCPSQLLTTRAEPSRARTLSPRTDVQSDSQCFVRLPIVLRLDGCPIVSHHTSYCVRR